MAATVLIAAKWLSLLLFLLLLLPVAAQGNFISMLQTLAINESDSKAHGYGLQLMTKHCIFLSD